MTDRHIMFSAPMIQALLAGRKTQTRRKLDAWCDEAPAFVDGGRVTALDENDTPYRWPRTHAVGDRLWVKETHTVVRYSLDYETGGEESYFEWDEDYGDPCPFLNGSPRFGTCALVVYAADGEDHNPSECYPVIGFSGEVLQPAEIPWRPSIFMPRWASRLTLVVEDVRVERLRDISDPDAIAEGISPTGRGDEQVWQNYDPKHYGGEGFLVPSNSYMTLWNSIHGHGAWDENPWVAAYTFRVVNQNIDQMEPTP